MWIGGEIPDLVKKCVATHKLDGYEHLWIDNSNYQEFSCTYLDECIEAKLFGKASDYIRIAALEKYGGVYLDADAEVLKTFDDVLDNSIFACQEPNGFVANSIIGAEANHPLLKHYLGVMERNFRGGGELVFQPGMYLWTELIKHSEWTPWVRIYPSDWFLPYDHQSGVTNVTENTHTMHYYLKSWIIK